MTLTYDNRTMSDVDDYQDARIECLKKDNQRLRLEVERVKAEIASLRAIGQKLRDSIFYTMGTRALSPTMHEENGRAIDEAVVGLTATSSSSAA